jgi:ABC-type dipeptide/oligopeptide/nickel transport system permease subunit
VKKKVDAFFSSQSSLLKQSLYANDGFIDLTWNHMIRTIFFLFFFLLVISNKTYSQDHSNQNPPATFSLMINQDNAFGFYPQVVGSFPINNKLSFSFYSIFWSNASFGTPDFGTDLWTEMGIGLSFSALNGKMIMNPSIGFTHGKLLSGGDQGVPFDGIAPNIVGLIF